ncbi:antitoxin [Caulobacter sp. DWR2-3-1b2]|uniref:antitoxin n=1 Tax=unclassified Caulobacter TaxID=2648921 RepID=UPI0019C30F85|nr:AbrB/MazE/SpoVT family DNA-binding domain-containing protein [Caulobacter sp.]
MGYEKHVRLFRNGRNQAVRIPRGLEFPGDEAILRRDGDKLILEPAPPRSLLAVLASLQPIEEDFDPIDDPAPEPVEL